MDAALRRIVLTTFYESNIGASFLSPIFFGFSFFYSRVWYSLWLLLIDRHSRVLSHPHIRIHTHHHHNIHYTPTGGQAGKQGFQWKIYKDVFTGGWTHSHTRTKYESK